MQNKISSLFSAEKGKNIYSKAVNTIKDNSIVLQENNGVIVGLSGGADSIMLLCFLLEYRKNETYFPILAVHVNHGIRGSDAEMDESFSKNFCLELGVDFLSVKIDVPNQAKIDKIGIEECARNMRYSKFNKIISSRDDLSYIAVAHNADDNLETVILNMLRGSGTRGASGIPPVRDNIIRPLIKVIKSDITDALCTFGIPYVTDKTNFDNDYNRNFIRNVISPKLSVITEKPALMLGRMSDNLRADDEFICNCADDFLASHDKVLNKDLLNLHKSLRARVISKMVNNKEVSISGTNLDDIYHLLKKDNFKYSLPAGYVFLCERGVCSVISSNDAKKIDYLIKINNGENYISEYKSVFCLFDDSFNNSSLNIYKLSIQADISSAIIEGDLYLRPKRDGDRVFYGGMTHKIKKLYSDRKIPVSKRPLIPLLCDNKGVVWAPGFGVRDDRGADKSNKKIYASIYVDISDKTDSIRFYLGTEFG